MEELAAVAKPLSTIPKPELVLVSERPAAAVLVPLCDGPEGPELLLTRRAWHLRSHKGEVSFPGGRHEPQDATLVDTALRETEEEVAVAPELVTPVGRLDGLTTVSSPAPIVPVLGVLDHRPSTVPSPDEVDDVLHVSIAELWDPTIYRSEVWSRDGAELEVTFFELVGDTLWGATGRIVRSWFCAVAGVDPMTGTLA